MVHGFVDAKPWCGISTWTFYNRKFYALDILSPKFDSTIQQNFIEYVVELKQMLDTMISFQKN